MTTTIRTAIDDVVTEYSDRIHSHKSGWARMLRCLAQDAQDGSSIDFHDNEVKLLTSKDGIDAVGKARTWLVAHPMDFNGETYNLFGGWSADTYWRVMRFLKHPNVISLERPMSNLTALLRPRAEKTKSNMKPEEWDALEKKCAATPVMPLVDLVQAGGLVNRRVVLGDSHSLAHYIRGSLVLRHDGLTLHRLLDDGIRSRLPDFEISHLVICAGNIDIRHHLLRRHDWMSEVTLMVTRLRHQLEELMSLGAIRSFEVVTPMPIECEDRRIPKTGWYKGTPFYGSAGDRDNVRDYMTMEMETQFERIFLWPKSWHQDPYWFSDNRMEKPQSVHLSPAWHRWDYISNRPNDALQMEYR